jgi:hypothetical protein
MAWKEIIRKDCYLPGKTESLGAGNNGWEQLLPFLCQNQRQQRHVLPGDQVVPLKDSKWDYEDECDGWEKEITSYFAY